MFYMKTLDPDGNYVNVAGERFSISAVRRVRSPKGVNVDYEEFSTLQDALAAWELRVGSGDCLKGGDSAHE